ncbi:multifunctional CCA tRNA nucleotidyl transferase/2'3'-cyclic phosphodiesterase/2'nucleotidase/phosphatase, partial [Acinetobacter baumannii]
AQYMREAMQIVRSIKVQDLPENIKGAEIGEMLIQYRIEALAEFKNQHQSLSHS